MGSVGSLLSTSIWMNGQLVPFEQATVPFLATALHYGLAAFEGIRAYGTERGPAVFRLPEHIARLVDSARVLGLALPYSAEDLTRATLDTVAANGFADCYIRPLVYVASGAMNLNTDTATTGVGIAVWEWSSYLGPEARANGVRANVSSFTRHHPNVMMTKAKLSGNYVNSALAKTESVRLGFDEAILLDPWGFVAECSGQNIFFVRRGAIVTPPAATVLEGITRDALVTIARDLGYSLTEAPVSRDQLYMADEVFVCGTASEVVGFREIDFRKIGTGRTGPVTTRLQEVFHEVVRGRVPAYERWLTYVPKEAPVEA